MIVSDEGKVRMVGTTGEIAADMLAIMGAFNNEVKNGGIEIDVLYDMFTLTPEIVTTFTQNFVKATHK